MTISRESSPLALRVLATPSFSLSCFLLLQMPFFSIILYFPLLCWLKFMTFVMEKWNKLKLKLQYTEEYFFLFIISILLIYCRFMCVCFEKCHVAMSLKLPIFDEFEVVEVGKDHVCCRLPHNFRRHSTKGAKINSRLVCLVHERAKEYIKGKQRKWCWHRVVCSSLRHIRARGWASFARPHSACVH